MENTAIQSTKHSQRRKLNQANPIFHQKNKNKMNAKNTLINNNSLKILNRSLKADQMSIGWPCFPFSIFYLSAVRLNVHVESIIPGNTRAWLCSYSLISLSRGVFALYKLGRPKIRRIKRLKLA
jgi:hypothetical protein